MYGLQHANSVIVLIMLVLGSLFLKFQLLFSLLLLSVSYSSQIRFWESIQELFSFSWLFLYFFYSQLYTISVQFLSNFDLFNNLHNHERLVSLSLLCFYFIFLQILEKKFGHLTPWVSSFLSLIFHSVPKIFFWTNPDGHIMLYIS